MESSINGEDIEFLTDILKALARTSARYNKEEGVLPLAGYSQKDGKLYLHSYKTESKELGDFVELKMTKPEGIAHFLYIWLENQEYEDDMDFDGSVEEGWRLLVGLRGWMSIVITFQPELILYGK
jgi:hypothetical protein